MLLCLLAVTACSDSFDLAQSGGENPLNQDKGIGQFVLFSSGNTSNSTTRAVIPYMEKEGRFVCKMFYHAKATDTDASPFDTVSTPITSWLRVDDNEGNSVYWQKDFDMAGVNTSHQDYLDYGFDSRAQYFYWRNRLDHIFLGFTDYNQLKTNTYGTTQGKLFMYPEADGAKKTKTGTQESWPVVGYKQLKFGMTTNPAYDADAKAACDAEMAQWEIEKAEWEAEYSSEYPIPCPDAYDVPEQIFGIQSVDAEAKFPSYASLSYFPLSTAISEYLGISQATISATRTKVLAYVDAALGLSPEEKTTLKEDLGRLGDSEPESNSEGTYRYERWYIYFNPDVIAYDGDGAIDLERSEICLLCNHKKQKMEDIIAVAPANTFDLTRGEKTSMAQQPDPLIALTKMKPTGATQEANRVRLYFKHQFSQIQVNLVNAENTAEITADNIVSVELLGVSKKGYVFTNINPNGTQIPPTYDPVVISQYTEEQQKKNPYGTSFNMFVMNDTEKPQTSLKSFNAIAFGQLQAIRITWQEEPTGEFYDDVTAAEENAKHLVTDGNGKKPGEDGYTTKYEAGYTPVNVGDVVPPVKHVATYKITVDDRGNSLVNLKSGFRYMYDFELRRGTIAFIRATIDGWRLSDDLNYGTSGTITPDPIPEPDPTPDPTPEP